MLRYLAGRLVLAFWVALAVSALSFVLLRLSGDVALALAGEGASGEDLQIIRDSYGLERPLVVQYLTWLGQCLRGDLGESLYFRMPAAQLLWQ